MRTFFTKPSESESRPMRFPFHIVISTLCVCLISRTSHADIVSVLDIEVRESDMFVDVPIWISGGSDIQSLSLGFSVGDGGPALGGSETIRISDVFYQGGTIFDGFPLTVSEGIALPARGATIANVSINQANTDVAAGGLFTSARTMIIRLDVSSASAGEVLTLNPNAGLATQASNSRGGIVPLTFMTGRLTVSAVPEPSVPTALVIGTGLLIGSRWRKRLSPSSCETG